MCCDKVTCRESSTSKVVVPSRYVLRVGGLDVLIVSDGMLTLPLPLKK